MSSSVFLRLVSSCVIALAFASCGGSEPARTAAAVQPTWDYVALGDSLAVGAIAQRGYVSRYAGYVSTDTSKQIRTNNLGVSGWQSSDLLNAIKTDATMRAAIQNAQVITFDIGGNDLLHANRLYLEGSCGGSDNLECFRAGVAQFATNWDAIVAELIELKRPETAVIRTMNIYNPFVAVQKATGTFSVLRPFLDDINQHIAASAAANNIRMADIYSAFNGVTHDEDAAAKGWMSFDGVHPNDDGHEAIAQALRSTGYSPLQ